jgi:peroxiredoxin
MNKFLYSIIFIFITISSWGQKTFHIEFHAEKCSTKRDLSFFFDDGEKIIPAQVSQQTQDYSIEGSYFGKFAILEIREKIDSALSIQTRYLLNETPAKIQYTVCNTASLYKYWQNIYTENVIDFISFYKNLRAFSTRERIKFDQEQEKFDVFFKQKPLPDIEIILRVKKVAEVALTNYHNKQFEFISSNSSDYRAFVQFREIITQKQVLESDNVREVFSSFPSELRNSFEGKKLAQLIDEKRNRFDHAPELGKLAPNFKTTDIEGKDIELADFKGKYVLLVFWATWCAQCVKEIPDIKAIRNKYKPYDLAIIYISDDSDKNRFLNFIKKKQMNWNHIYGNKTIAKDYFVNGIPETVLINKEGKIIHINVGNEVAELQKMLSANIKKN